MRVGSKSIIAAFAANETVGVGRSRSWTLFEFAPFDTGPCRLPIDRDYVRLANVASRKWLQPANLDQFWPRSELGL